MSFSVAVPVSTHCEDVMLRVHRRRRQPVPATDSIRPPLAAARTAMLDAREQNTRESYLRGIEAGTRVAVGWPGGISHALMEFRARERYLPIWRRFEAGPSESLCHSGWRRGSLTKKADEIHTHATRAAASLVSDPQGPFYERSFSSLAKPPVAGEVGTVCPDLRFAQPWVFRG